MIATVVGDSNTVSKHWPVTLKKPVLSIVGQNTNNGRLTHGAG
jgi:hypothetical protein